MYILVANDFELCLELYFADDFELSDSWYYDSEAAYSESKKLLIGALY